MQLPFRSTGASRVMVTHPQYMFSVSGKFRYPSEDAKPSLSFFLFLKVRSRSN